MGKHDVASFDDDSKAIKTKRVKGDRYAFHQCFHGDAWLGVMDLSGLATGIYWKIILRMYIKRGAMHDDDADMARICNESVKNYRRAKKELIAAGRIIVDEENGILYDERAIRELEAANRLSDAQTTRAKTRWKKEVRARSKPRMVVNNEPPACANDVQPSCEVGANSVAKSSPTLAPIIESIEESLCRSDANHIQNHKDKTKPPEPAAEVSRSPLNRGGSPPDPYPPTSDPEARRAAMLAAMTDEETSPADRTCKRRAK